MDEQPRYTAVPVTVYNSLVRKSEPFQAHEPPFVGMYVCGPTVYSDPHLGHARTAVAFDIVFRFLRFLGYRVRYVRNVTDVGHLEDEQADAGEDKIAKRARLERLEPMEVVQRYTLSYHDGLQKLGCLPPSIEPRASGHIPEQIDVVNRIFDAGLAYESDGSVYFDLARYVSQSAEGSPYGQLSGKIFDDLMSNTRDTAGSDQKRSPLDFALWKRAEPGHIMRWNSPWGDGFPGWHLECTTMSTKYLGETFDIHGGGLDLQFPHHEAEIAQNHGAFKRDPARYWLHSNMLTVDGQKMAKSLGNFITLQEMFTGAHARLEQAFSPMVLRFFMLQSHYRSTLDFSNEALIAAEKGYQRLMNALARAEEHLQRHGRTGDEREPASTPHGARAPIGPTEDAIARAGRETPLPESFAAWSQTAHESAVGEQVAALWRAMAEDFHTPRAIAALFELGRLIQRPEHAGSSVEFQTGTARVIRSFIRNVLGLAPATDNAAGGVGERGKLEAAVELLISLRAEARARKDFSTSDAIRDQLAATGIQLEDRKDGTTGWRS